MTRPGVPEVQTYLQHAGNPADDTAVTTALGAEVANQARVCHVPAADADWPADLTEALCRRVARNLAMRNIVLGVQMDGEGGIRIGSNDPEVRRLEQQHRKRVVG